MNLLFIYISEWGTFNYGVASISAVLKQAGHSISFRYIDPGISPADFKKDLLGKISGYDGYLISSVTDSFECAKTIIPLIREVSPQSAIILGGIHATIAPEEAIAVDGITAICIGEGEYAINEFFQHWSNGPTSSVFDLETISDVNGNDAYTTIIGLWIKKGDQIYKNPTCGRVGDLDELPFADYSLFPYEDILDANNGELEFFANRGCPYPCSFCVNVTLIEQHKSQGKYVRFRNIDKVIEELKLLRSQFPSIKSIEFYDDTFILKKDWLYSFLPKYKKEINLPFQCNGRANILKEEFVAAVKDAGCYQINMAIETGNQALRKTVLSKNVTDEQLKKAFGLVNKYGMTTYAHNMIGLPDETEEMIQETIDMNREVGVTKVQVSVFRPYPATPLYDYCNEKNLISDRKGVSYRSPQSTLDLPDLPPKVIRYNALTFIKRVKKPYAIKTKLYCFVVRYEFLYNFLRRLKLIA